MRLAQYCFCELYILYVFVFYRSYAVTVGLWNIHLKRSESTAGNVQVISAAQNQRKHWNLAMQTLFQAAVDWNVSDLNYYNTHALPLGALYVPVT